ncbi:hypothetical protein HDU85_004294 [Gaertneriomyces sp. JEL0708]|nr:hypothetical protein HDU85_004294 [Gaertneriomyces sp. JEL0708]
MVRNRWTQINFVIAGYTAIKRESIQVNVLARQVAYQKEGDKDYGGDSFARKVKDPTPRSKELTAEVFKEVKLQTRSYQLKEHAPSKLEYWACLLGPEGWHCENVGPPLVDMEYICKCLESVNVDELKTVYRAGDVERLREQCARLTVKNCDDDGFQLVTAVDGPSSVDNPSSVDGW